MKDGFVEDEIDVDKIIQECKEIAARSDDTKADLSEHVKASKTVDLGPNRFHCSLSKSALRQRHVKREYIDTLPYYREKEEKYEAWKADGLKQRESNAVY